MGSVFDNGGYIGVSAEYGQYSIVSDGLIVALDASDLSSYPGTGTTWFDTSGNNNHGTIFGGAVFDKNSLIFDGVDDYVQLPAGFSNFSNGLTIFVFADFGNASNWERIIDFGNGPSDNNMLIARVSTSNNLAFEIYNGSTSLGKCVVVDGVLNNTITQYAVTLNGSNCLIYRNGQLLQGFSYPYLPINITRNSCYIGKSNWADALFEKSMGNIMIYNRALTSSEISQNYNALKGRYGL